MHNLSISSLTRDLWIIAWQLWLMQATSQFVWNRLHFIAIWECVATGLLTVSLLMSSSGGQCCAVLLLRVPCGCSLQLLRQCSIICISTSSNLGSSLQSVIAMYPVHWQHKYHRQGSYTSETRYRPGLGWTAPERQSPQLLVMIPQVYWRSRCG